MTKKDYELIASVIAWLDVPNVVRRDVAEQFAQALAEGNPRFSREIFVAACAAEDTEDAEAIYLAKGVEVESRDGVVGVVERVEAAAGFVYVRASGELLRYRPHELSRVET